MGSEWQSASVQELATKVTIGPFGSSLKTDSYTPSGVPVIRGTNLCGGRAFIGDWVYVSDSTADRLPAAVVSAGDLVFPHRGSIGEVGIVPNDKPRYLLSTSLMRASFDEDICDPRFYFYFFKSQVGRSELLKNASQVGTPGIGQPLSTLKAIRVPFPPRFEQERIANILSTLDDRIDHNRALAANLEAIARRLFKSWFVDFDPVRAKVAGEKLTGLADDLAALFPDRFVDSELGEIPEGWSCRKVSDLCAAIFSGGTPHTQTPEYWGGELPWFSSGETRSRFVVGTEKTITEAGVKNSSTRLARAGDIVIASAGQGATRGQTSLLAIDTHINQSVVALRAATEVYSSGLLFLDLSSRYEEMRAISDSHSSRGSLTTKLLGGMKSIAPPKPVIAEFDALISPIIERIVVAERETSRLGTIRDLLLPRLISGKLRVADAESFIEEAIA